MYSTKKLLFNDKVLSLFESYLEKTDDLEDFVNHVKFLGSYLASSPCSQLYSPVIDKLILKFQKELKSTDQESRNGRTLHVATQIYLTGGHTRVIENWINFSVDEEHDVVLTEQYRHFQINTPVTTKILRLDDHLTISQKVHFLNELYSQYDKIIFHIHQHDVIPLIAMGNLSKNKFFFYNHADHTFSIGPSLVGEVYDMSEGGRIFSLSFRGALSSKVIPFPLVVKNTDFNLETKLKLREKLGLKAESKIVLSVGTNYKFIPNDDFNLLKSFEPIAERNDNYIFIFIGPDQSFSQYLSRPLKNIHFLGLVSKETVLDYYKASDLYIDSLPVSGGLALIESILSGLPIITFDNGFNAFDAAEKFRRPYEALAEDIKNLLENDEERAALQKKGALEARRHQKEYWLENFKNSSLAKDQVTKLKPEKLSKYCQMLVAKYPPFQIPRTSYKISHQILLDMMTFAPHIFVVKIFLFQRLFPLIKPFISFIKDKKRTK